MSRICIPDSEYQERIKRCAALVAEKGYDVFLVNSNEADYANVRYFSNFWPLFERAGVAITPAGKAALLVGPESTIFAADRSKIEKIYTMLAYRESADPAYPELSPMEYDEVFRDMGITGKHIKIAIASFLDTNCEMLRR